ncbi:MAG: ABC transporter ATP-binding protein [Candidatus Gastranaerophilales bacterium]|nr:ABC transporter ATP-binding protein [Candidatus Gastranaerophilales bacterium]
MDNILEIKNINVGFKIEDNFYYALNNINLSFKKGKIHAIAGESGCGKSVLINTILKLLPKNGKIRGGEIVFQNKNLLTLSDKEIQNIRGAKISLIPQDPFMSLNPLYTIENQLLEVKNDIEIIKKSLEEVKIKNIENVLKSYPHELSGGMKQRIIIAMSLISGAELILADEPTTALDVSTSNSILDLLVNLKNKGKTIILITHDLSIVSNYCDTTTIMYLGNIIEQNESKLLFKNPLHPYTKALLSALPTKKGKKLENIKGQISPITETISGCKFHPRCNFTMDTCKNIKPELKKHDNGYCACFLCNQ